MATHQPISVRSLGESDWQILRQLRLAALAESPDAFLPHADENSTCTAERWRRDLNRRKWFGAFADGDPIGLVCVVVDPETGLHYAESMWVDPAGRRQGVSKELLLMAEHHVSINGGTKLRLWVLDGNHNAPRVYTSYGFVPTGRRQPTVRGVDEIEYEHVLS